MGLFNKGRKKTERSLEEEQSQSPFQMYTEPQVVTRVKLVKSKSSKPRNFRIKSIISICIIILIVIFGSIAIYGNSKSNSVGVRAVMDMYNFDSIQQLANQQNDLKSITTASVFDFNTVENYNTSLTTYLKFKQSPVHVNIIDTGKGWVLYSLDSPYIAPSRHFLMLYKTNWLGTITYMRQEEAIDFFSYNK